MTDETMTERCGQDEKWQDVCTSETMRASCVCIVGLCSVRMYDGGRCADSADVGTGCKAAHAVRQMGASDIDLVSHPDCAHVCVCLVLGYLARLLHSFPHPAMSSCPPSRSHDVTFASSYSAPCCEWLLTSQVDPKFLRNQRYAKHGTEKAVREARAASA